MEQIRKGHRAVVMLGALAACAAVVSMAAEKGSAEQILAPQSHAAPTFTKRTIDSTAVARTIQRFQRALAQGDSAAAMTLLAPDAVILESGDSESVAEYRAHHLPADIEFARAVKNVRTPTRVTVRGDAAWSVTTSIARGKFRGRPINSAGVELMVLTRSTDGWRIAAIHWSSRRRGA
jgi:ketosteroid isomerase-like protein